MRLLADWMVVDGTLRRDWGLVLDASGVVREVQPAASLGRPDAYLRDAVLAPGAVDACALAALVAPDLGAQASAPEVLQALAQLGATLPAAVLQARAVAVLCDALAAGVTTVALPHLAVRGALGGTEGAPPRPSFAVADALVAAANVVGVRLVLLDALVLRPGLGAGGAQALAEGPGAEALLRCSHVGFEASLAYFDSFVRSLIDQQNTRLSWGLLLASPASLGADGFVGLRTRLGHMPVQLLDAGETLTAAVPQLRGDGAPVSLVGQVLASGALDASCSLLRGRAAAPLSHADHAALQRWGAPVLRPPGSDLQAPSGPSGPWGSASGLDADPYAQPGWLGTSLCVPGESSAFSPARRAASALGLHGGALRADTWADYLVVRGANGTALPQDPAVVQAALQAQQGQPRLVVEEAYVAGQQVLADGRPVLRSS